MILCSVDLASGLYLLFVNIQYIVNHFNLLIISSLFYDLYLCKTHCALIEIGLVLGGRGLFLFSFLAV